MSPCTLSWDGRDWAWFLSWWFCQSYIYALDTRRHALQRFARYRWSESLHVDYTKVKEDVLALLFFLIGIFVSTFLNDIRARCSNFQPPISLPSRRLYTQPIAMSDLPTLDFSLFTKGDEAQSKQCAQKIVQSFRDHGFVKLTNHGIPEETVKTYMGAVSRREKKKIGRGRDLTSRLSFFRTPPPFHVCASQPFPLVFAEKNATDIWLFFSLCARNMI
jgi:hypothetical protein